MQRIRSAGDVCWYPVEFGDFIVSSRASMSQKDLAACAQIDHSYLCRIENYKVAYPPKIKFIDSIAKCLGLSDEDYRYMLFFAGKLTSIESYGGLFAQHGIRLYKLLELMQKDLKFANKVFSLAAPNSELKDSTRLKLTSSS